MTGVDPHLLVRVGVVYLMVMATLAAWIWRRPSTRVLTGTLLAFCWNLPSLLLVNLAATRLGWWTFDARGGLFLGMPVDLYLAWAWLWALPSLALPSMPMVAVLSLALAADVALMPLATPILQLSTTWLVGESVALVVALVPAQLLARWTSRDEHLAWRAVLQMLAFAGLVVFVLPAMAIEGTHSRWQNPLAWPLWRMSLVLQLLGLPAILGISAVQEFVTRGRGTPIPFDPPRRLVSSGLYAYVGNPMQVSGVLLLLLLGLAVQNIWVAAIGVMAHVYSIGLAGWDEDDDLQRRFGTDWTEYRRGVRRWWPRWRPWQKPGGSSATLYVSEYCDMCQDVASWFAVRRAVRLLIVPAERHPSRALTRITYESPDGLVVSGIPAVARALEHLHFGWAIAGAVMRLPVACQLIQLIVDASGGGPRSLQGVPSAAAATCALDQAHWKLNPPIRPSTSRISPTSDSPSHTRERIVAGSISSSKTPPAVTSA